MKTLPHLWYSEVIFVHNFRNFSYFWEKFQIPKNNCKKWNKHPSTKSCKNTKLFFLRPCKYQFVRICKMKSFSSSSIWKNQKDCLKTWRKWLNKSLIQERNSMKSILIYFLFRFQIMKKTACKFIWMRIIWKIWCLQDIRRKNLSHTMKKSRKKRTLYFM